MKRVTSKYPDAALAKALWKVLKVSETDPYRTRIAGREAKALLELRGAGPTGSGEPLERALHDAWWILFSVVSMGTMAADYRERLAACARYFDAARKRRRPSLEVRSLTPRQVEVMQIASECETNLAETARRMGLHRKTVEQHYRAACKKLGIKAVTGKPKTHSIPLDRRGQEDVAAQSDGLAPPKAPARVKRDKRAGVC